MARPSRPKSSRTVARLRADSRKSLTAATPPERKPAWFVNAKLSPLASASAQALKALAPKGLEVAHSVAPAMRDAVDDTAPGPDTPKAKTAPARPGGYSEGQRKSLDDLVEKSR